MTALSLALVACGGAAPHASSPLARDVVLVRVESAVIEGVDSTTGQTWDPATRDDSERHDRQVDALSTLLGLASPALGALVAVVGALGAPTSPTEASPDLPDVTARISIARGVHVREIHSAVLSNTTHPAWNLAAWVHLDDLAGESLSVSIEDADGNEASITRIGTVRVPLGVLREVATTRSPRTLDLADGDLRRVRVSILPPTEEVLRTQTHLELRQGLRATGAQVAAGSTVRVRVTGGGRIGGGFSCPPNVGTAGVSRGCERYSYRGLGQAPHGAPFVMLGSERDLDMYSLAGPPGACFELTAGSSGELVVGVNDTDYDNNRGAFEFDVEIMAPQLDAPRRGVRPCSTP